VRLRIKSLEQTCGACPSQWEGEMENGARIFIHYRYGWLSVDIDDVHVFGQEVGDSFGGVMDTEQMLRITGLRMADG
jgi:hypothetical protein